MFLCVDFGVKLGCVAADQFHLSGLLLSGQNHSVVEMYPVSRASKTHCKKLRQEPRLTSIEKKNLFPNTDPR